MIYKSYDDGTRFDKILDQGTKIIIEFGISAFRE